MQKEIRIKTTDKKTIFGTLDTPKGKSKGLIIFLHGLTSSIQEPIIQNGSKYFTKQGFTTYRFNFYGEEKNARKLESTSFKNHITDTNNVLKYFYFLGYKNIYLVGHSIGGLTILYSKLTNISGIILRDPSIGGKELLEDVIYDKKNKQYMVNRGDENNYPINKIMYKDFCIPSSYHIERISKIKKPIKIICAEHGLQKAGKRYFKNITGPKDFIIIPETGHCFDEKGAKEKLFAETYDRIKKN